MNKTNFSTNEVNNSRYEITKTDFRKILLRSLPLDASWNYERQQHLAWSYTMCYVTRKLYDDKDDIKRALHRHLEFMAITPHLSPLLYGIVTSMEIENAQNPDFDETSISAVKSSLMGPLAGIGDSLFWGTLKTIAAGVSISLAMQGNALAPLMFILIINVPAIFSRYFGLKYGLKYGAKLFSDAKSRTLFGDITKAATIMGLMVVGGMVASMVSFKLALGITVGDRTVLIQSFIDDIMPNLFPAVIFVVIYYAIGKGVKAQTIVLLMFILGVLLSFLKIV